MNNRQLSFLAALFLLVSSSLLAQRPEAVKYKGSLKGGLRQGCAGSEAGTFTLQGGGLASTRNVKYLCPGDTLTLTHKGNFTFMDPVPATKPGIGYVYFDCKPTKEAKTLGELLTDPCINKTSPINNNGTPLAQKGGLWIAKGSFNDGNIKFYNDGYQQIAFSNGKPRQFWFAPVTVDNFSPNGNQTDFENTNGVPGACIDLNIDSAFSVVYLNALKLSGITGTNNGVGNYTGTFTATGGIPEFDTSANYTVVSMVNDRDPNAIGRLTNGPAKNGMAMNFSVPKPGKYIITISDANGCSISSFVTIAQDPVDIKVGCADGNIGQEVCIPIRIGKVSDLTAAQFTFSFNPQAMTFSGAKNVNPKLEQTVDQIVITNAIDQGFIKFFWIDFNLMPHDFTNEEVLIEFCFTIKGPPGPTKVNIVPDPGTNYPKLEFSNIDGNSLPVSSLSNLDCTFNINPGSNVDVFYSQCGQTLYGQIFNGVSPYRIYYSLLTDPSNIDSVITNQSQPFPIFSNKTGGDYILLTKDASGTILRDTFKYNAALNNLSLDLSNLLPESCRGGDGKITVIPSGGTGPGYRYTWSTGSISSTIQSLKAGKYFVTVTDAQGCMATDSVILISEKPKSAILIDRMPLCSGVSDGRTSPDFGAILGIRPYTFKWIGTGTMIGNAFTNLAEGRVGLIVTDAKGCSDTAYANISVQKNITATKLIEPLQCFNEPNGRITLSNRKFTDGSAIVGEIVKITNPQGKDSLFAIRPDIRYDGLQSGTYFASIKDQNSCIFLDTLQVTEPQILDTAKVTIKPESCRPGADGSIAIQMKGGTGPYQYKWADIPTDTSLRTGLVQGNYSVTITDKNGCATNFNGNLLNFNFTKVVIPVSIDTTAIKCFGQSGTATAIPGPGYTIESYKWSTGDTTITAKNVFANVPTFVEVTDITGCKGADTVILSQPARISLTDSTLINNPCPGLAQGTIRLTATGGTGPYTYLLNNGATQDFGQFSKLLSGKYTVTITDANQCPSFVVNTELLEPPKIVAIFDTIAFRGVKCAGDGDCSGQAKLLLSGGTDPQNRFQVRWQSGELNDGILIATADSLCAGKQQVTVFDGNGCSTKLDFTITSPTEIMRDVDRTSFKDIACFGQANGSINYTATGGTSPYKYLWNDNDTNSTRTGLLAGRYTLNITDLNNCRFTDSITLTVPTALLVTLDSIKTRAITCPLSNDGQIGVKVTGGNSGGLMYKWTPNQSDTNFLRNISPGTYSVVVTDLRGCSDTLSNIIMNAPPGILVDLNTLFTPLCAGDTASIFINAVSGGNGASYSFAINNGTSIPIANTAPLKAGKYQLTIFDRKGCAIDTSINVVDPTRFAIDVGPDQKIHLGDSIRISTLSNNPLGKVTWQGNNVICLNPDCSVVSLGPVRNETFKVSAVDQNGCKAIDEIEIVVDTRRAVYIPNAFKPDQLGINQDFRLFTGTGITRIHYGRIFNRWGDVVAEVRDLGPDPGGVVIWNGRFRGIDAKPDVYVYAIDIEFSDGVRLVYKGDVTLVR